LRNEIGNWAQLKKILNSRKPAGRAVIFSAIDHFYSRICIRARERAFASLVFFITLLRITRPAVLHFHAEVHLALFFPFSPSFRFPFASFIAQAAVAGAELPRAEIWRPQ